MTIFEHMRQIDEWARALVAKMKHLDAIDLDWLASLSKPRLRAFEGALREAYFEMERDDVRGTAWVECAIFGADCKCTDHRRAS